MAMGTCKVCGSAVPYVAAACPHCGTTHKAHAIGLALVLGVLALVVVGTGFGLGLYLSQRMDLGVPADSTAGAGAPPTTASPSGAPAVAARPSDDFSWLRAGMDSCDSEAANDLPKVYFLVVPLLAANPNDETW